MDPNAGNISGLTDKLTVSCHHHFESDKDEALENQTLCSQMVAGRGFWEKGGRVYGGCRKLAVT